MDALLKDVRHGLRLIRRSPGLTVAAVLALALGIGPATALFTVIDRVLLTPLPYHESDRLIRVFETNRTEGIVDTGLSPPAFDDVRRQASTLAGVAAYSNRQYDLVADDASETVQGTIYKGMVAPVAVLGGLIYAVRKNMSAEEHDETGDEGSDDVR